MPEIDKKNEKVQILMSVYNGEKYLREQIDSILGQSYDNIQILIRDDGSTDRSMDILQEYQKIYPNISVIKGRNIGLTPSFIELLGESDADYVAFCDQDDVWMENKIEKAVEKLKAIKMPALYCSNQILVNEQLEKIDNGKIPHINPGFGNAVIESVCTGCTVVMNEALIKTMKGHLPTEAIWHDWWCYMVASYLGTVIFDENAYIYYRQHGNNQLGLSRNAFVMIRNKWNFLKNTRGMLGRQLENFAKEYRGDEEKDALVDMLCASKTSFKARVQVIFNKKIYRQKALDRLAVKVLCLVNRLL